MFGVRVTGSSRWVVLLEFEGEILYVTEVDAPTTSATGFFSRKEPTPYAVVGREGAPFVTDGKTSHDRWKIEKVGHDVEG